MDAAATAQNPETVARLSLLLGLDQRIVERVLREFLALTDQTTADWVRRRHAALQREGLRNQQIFAQIQRELGQHRFAAPELSQRQLRRLVYG